MKRTIVGTQQCHATLLCVTAADAEAELLQLKGGIGRGPLDIATKGIGFDHMLVATAFGAARSLIVAVTQMDAVEYSEVRRGREPWR